MKVACKMPDLKEIAHALLGTTLSPAGAAEKYGIPDIEEKMLDFNVEYPTCCGWWVESYELLGEDSEVDGYCDNCRPSEV